MEEKVYDQVRIMMTISTAKVTSVTICSRNDQVLECFNSRDSVSETPVHVINMNVVDNPEDATIGAFLLCELAQLLTVR